MKRISAKRSKLNRAVKPLRDEYRDEFPFCQWCGEPATELHEISRGAARGASLGVRAAWLHLCAECHRHMSWLPVDGQLGIKRQADPEGYDRIAVNRLRGRADDAISEADVERWLRRFNLGMASSPAKYAQGESTGQRIGSLA